MAPHALVLVIRDAGYADLPKISILIRHMKENNNSNMLADGLVIFLIVPNITLQLLCKYVVRYYFLYSIIIRF